MTPASLAVVGRCEGGIAIGAGPGERLCVRAIGWGWIGGERGC